MDGGEKGWVSFTWERGGGGMGETGGGVSEEQVGGRGVTGEERRLGGRGGMGEGRSRERKGLGKWGLKKCGGERKAGGGEGGGGGGEEGG